MITIIYSTHKDSDYNDKFKKHLLDTVGLKNVQILEYVNNNQYSLSQVYNSGITESIYNIVCCIHNDIKLEKNWGKKLLSDFSNYPDFGIIGKAGSCYFPESGIYWEKLNQTMVGQVYHHPEGQKKWINKYSVKLSYLIPVVTIDGLFISFDKTKIKYYFDETIGKFHFYDHGFCIPNYLDGIKLGVTSSFEITHKSVGQPNEEFWESKEKFVEKWKSKLPLDLKPNFVDVPEIKNKIFKKFKKIAIIIPTKGNVNLLIDCINSFFDNCNIETFEIIIADTGSSVEEKKIIKKEIQTKPNVKLVEYDFYNFSKINNDIVKNYTNDNHEFLLFCNNDVKILNNVLVGMLSVFEKNPKVGTVGCRLHFDDNTVQHNGIFMGIHKSNKNLGVGHLNIGSYYNYKTDTTETFGNTAALMMIRKNVFLNCGMFNENYISCFEDVELNVKTKVLGLSNFTCGNCVAYHYESKTRNQDPKKLEKLYYDYEKNLLPFVSENYEKIKKYFISLV